MGATTTRFFSVTPRLFHGVKSKGWVMVKSSVPEA
jgi:hypothetical protein